MQLFKEMLEEFIPLTTLFLTVKKAFKLLIKDKLYFNLQ